MLQSRDRDHTVFPQPTACQLFLPRIYKNITGFSIAQINLTSAFFYFRADKGNVKLQLAEKDKIVYDLASKPLLTNGNPTPLYITHEIREGSYSISQLLTEVQIQLNKVPLFYDFLNGFFTSVENATFNSQALYNEINSKGTIVMGPVK
jgi:hypothetical protein